MELENVFRNKMQELNCYAKDLGFINFKQWAQKEFDNKKINNLDSSKIALYVDMRNVISHGFAGKVIIDEEDIRFLDKYIKILKNTLGIIEEPIENSKPAETQRVIKTKEKGEDLDINKASKKSIMLYIEKLKEEAKRKGDKTLTLRAGNIEKEVGLKQRVVSVCTAMYACMNKNDEILQAPKSGYSTTVVVKYYL